MSYYESAQNSGLNYPRRPCPASEAAICYARLIKHLMVNNVGGREITGIWEVRRVGQILLGGGITRLTSRIRIYFYENLEAESAGRIHLAKRSGKHTAIFRILP